MSAETEESIFADLQWRGKQLGLHIERHREFNPARGGDLYVQQRAAIYTFNGGTGNPPSLLRYASADQVNEFLLARESK